MSWTTRPSSRTGGRVLHHPGDEEGSPWLPHPAPSSLDPPPPPCSPPAHGTHSAIAVDPEPKPPVAIPTPTSQVLLWGILADPPTPADLPAPAAPVEWEMCQTRRVWRGGKSRMRGQVKLSLGNVHAMAVVECHSKISGTFLAHVFFSFEPPRSDS